MPAVIVDPRSIRSFTSQAAFAAWLAKNHQKESEVYIRIYKKGSDTPTVSAAEALDVALCWGWIDAIRKSYDDASFLQRYTRRRPKSIWSQRNREYVARLIADGSMTPYGLAEVDAAKADGRWDKAYARARDMVMPKELLTAIGKEPKALATFERLSKQNLFALAFRLGNLKTEAGRKKRIAAFVEMLKRGEAPHPQAPKA